MYLSLTKLKLMQSPFLQSHITQLRPSATLAINERSAELIKAGRTVYRLGFGQSPFPVPEPVVAALQKAAHIKDYLPVQGLPLLRKAVALFNRFGLKIDSHEDRILIGPGSKELIFQAQLALDADLLLPSPSWVSYEPQAELARQKVYWLQTTEAGGWKISARILQKACLIEPDRHKMLILNYPNNPVGNTYTTEELEQIAVVARQHQLIIIADEIYGEVHHQGQHVSIAQYYPEGTIISSGLSKWCGAGGWRLGTLSFPEELAWLLAAMRVIASETFTSVSAPIQYAAVAAYAGGPVIEDYLRHSRLILGRIAQYVHSVLTGLAISCPPAEGGFYLFPNFKHYRSNLAAHGITTSIAMCEFFLQEWGIALLPGQAFGRPPEELTARLSFVDFDGSAALHALRMGKGTDANSQWLSTYCPRIVAAMAALQQGLTTISECSPPRRN